MDLVCVVLFVDLVVVVDEYIFVFDWEGDVDVVVVVGVVDESVELILKFFFVKVNDMMVEDKVFDGGMVGVVMVVLFS